MIGSIYPVPPSDEPVVVGGNVNLDDSITITGPTSITRTVYPLFIEGSAGRLVWSATVTVRGIFNGDDYDPATPVAVLFRLTSGTQRREVVRGAAVKASAVLDIRAGDAPATFQIVLDGELGEAVLLSERWLQVAAYEVGILPATPGFGDVSPNGVTPPPPSAGLAPREAASPARRSPQVRAAQRQETRRPDLLPRQSSLI